MTQDSTIHAMKIAAQERIVRVWSQPVFGVRLLSREIVARKARAKLDNLRSVTFPEPEGRS
ncbi:hypothetical protein [Kozakia baliensis]|uniref:hypothetical protein n=1 Tax=Kozakia baliensis TaxID=153496 RepID=UPI000496D662|nr:hypothetical protein [Kozakia baliensis]